jgi:hypothetical protein
MKIKTIPTRILVGLDWTQLRHVKRRTTILVASCQETTYNSSCIMSRDVEEYKSKYYNILQGG